MERYLKYLRAHGRGNAADEAEGRFELCVYRDSIANLSLESATRDDFEEWRERLRLDTVDDFDGMQIRLAHRKGRPAKLRTRYTVLNADGATHFAAQSKGKLPSAHLFTMDGELPWGNHDWARAFKAAVTKVNETAKGAACIPVAVKADGVHGASAYSFRHARISELLQIHGVDPLTVAHQTGTSLAMIEKHYFRFIQSAMAEKLRHVKGA